MDTKVIRGARIREARKKCKLTQADLAAHLDVSRVTISKYETGEIDPPIDKILAISNYLDCSISWLVDVEPSGKNSDDEKLKVGIATHAMKRLERELDLPDGTFVYRTPISDAIYSKNEKLNSIATVMDNLTERGQNTVVSFAKHLSQCPEYVNKQGYDNLITSCEKFLEVHKRNQGNREQE